MAARPFTDLDADWGKGAFNGDGFVKVVPYGLISRSVPLLSISFTLLSPPSASTWT
jgi:hypothetical protein